MKKSKFHKPDDIDKICNILKAYSQNTISFLMLLDSQISTHGLSSFCISYQLFSEVINDTKTMVEALTKLINLIKQERCSHDQVAVILANILRNFPWHDEVSREDLMPVLLLFKEYLKGSDSVLLKVLKDEIKSLSLKHDSDKNLFEISPHIEYLNAHGRWEDINHSVRLPSEPDWNIKSLGLPECPKLKALNLNFTKNLKVITFSGPMNSLEEINLRESGIESLNLPECPQLKKIDLYQTKNLKTLTFSGQMKSLEDINLGWSGIESLNLPECPKLKKINLYHTENLKTLIFSAPMHSLESVSLLQSGIESLDLPECPKLKLINLMVAKNLKEITFSGAMNNLEDINLAGSSIQKIVGAQYLPDAVKNKIPKNIILEESKKEDKPDALSSKLTIIKKSLKDLKQKLKDLSDKLIVLRGALVKKVVG